VGEKEQRRAARALVRTYHEARLADLIEHVASELERYRAAETDVYDVDETIHHYHRAAQELWKFCWSRGGGAHVQMVAGIIQRMADDRETTDWWESVPRRERV
jgi:hypothetical protein